MNTIYGQDICNYGAGTLRNCGEGFGGRKAFVALRKDFSRFLRFAAVLLLMVVGIGEVKGQPFTVTTDTDNPVYYLIQSFSNTSFYMKPSFVSNTNTTYVYTHSILTDDMKWFFLDAGGGYYYICRKNGDDIQYMYFSNTVGSTSTRVWIQLRDLDNNDTDHFKFSFAKNNTQSWDAYNIIPKGNTGSYCLNKRGQNSQINTTANTYDDGIQVSTAGNKTPGDFDDASCNWNFIALDNTYEWTLPSQCFSVSDLNNKYFYKIKSANATKGYIKPGTTYVESSTTEDDDMIWYFEEASSDDLMTYYYIKHANTGKYLRFKISGAGSNATELSNHTGNETGDDEARFQFIVVRGTKPKEPVNDNSMVFNIIPKLLKEASVKNINSLCCESNNNILSTKLLRSNGDNKNFTTHWTFESIDACEDPIIGFNSATGKGTLSSSTTGASIYYTIATGTEIPATPTSTTGTLYDAENGIPVSENTITTIKAIASKDGLARSEVVTKTIIYMPTITLSGGPYTYDGEAKTPSISSVMVGETPVSADDYDISYENNTNAGTAKIIIREKTGNETIIYGTKDFNINPKAVTITASDGSKTYNSTALTEGGFTATALEDDDSHTFTVAMTEESTITNVGTQPNVIATVDGTAVTTGTETAVGNYLVTIVNGTLTINPKAVTITASDGSKTYNNSALSEPGFTASALEEGDTYTFTVVMTAGSTITNVGTQPNVIATVDGVAVTTGTETAIGNYLVTTANGTLTINPKAVTITAKDASKVYNGSALTESGFEATALETDDEHTFTVVMTEGSTITNVGTQPNVIATVDGVAVTTGEETAVGNYLVTTVNGTLEVTNIVVTITADSDTKVYDGTPLTKGTYTVAGLQTDDAIESVTITGSQTVAGTSDNVPSAAVIKNASNEDVTSSYTIKYVNGTLEVTQKPLTITADGDTKVYDGTALAKNSYTNTALATNDVIESVTVTGSQTVAGTSNNVPSAAVIKNGSNEDVTASYNITYTNGTLEVTQKALTITADSDTKTYDGTALTKNSYTNTALAEGDAIESVTVTGSQTVAGSSNNVPSAAVIKNGSNEDVTASYNITYTNGTLEVTQKALTITADSDTKTYDGTALTKNSYTNTALATGDAFESVTVTGSQTEVGSSNNVPSTAVIKNGSSEDVTASYNITYTNGTLEVTAKSIGDGFIPATSIVITIDGNNVTVQDGDNTLTSSDFTASKDENDVWTITGINNYSGSAQVIALNLDFYETGETPTATDEDVKDVAPYQAPKNMVITGKSVYLVTGVTKNAVDLQKIDYAPEGVPVLLLDDLDGTPNSEGAINNKITVSVFTPTTPADVSSNILKKVTETGGMEVGFGAVYMFLKGRFVLTSDGTLPIGTFYFEKPNSQGTSGGTAGARVRIVVNSTTDIDNAQFIMHNSQLDESWYTIDGRRLNGKPTKKGLYIKRSADGRNSSVTVIK